MKIIKNLRIPRKNNENHAKRRIDKRIMKIKTKNRIPYENHENFENLKFHARIMKIMEI